MTVKTLKTAFDNQTPAETNMETDAPAKNAPEGCYPRSFRIIDFALHNLFSTAYAMPHQDNLPEMKNSADYLALLEMEFPAEQIDRSIDPATMLPDPVLDFVFEFKGAEDWAPFTATLVLRDTAGNPIEKQDAHPYMRDAAEDFMNDMALAANEMEGISVNVNNATIRANDPLMLYRALAELVFARNEDFFTALETLAANESDAAPPLEYRSINLPDDGYTVPTGNDDGERARLIVEGAVFMTDDQTQDVAFQNIPSRPYNDLTEVFLVAQDVKTKLEYGDPMLRLDEMEAIILQETRNQKSYKPNPLLNRH